MSNRSASPSAAPKSPAGLAPAGWGRRIAALFIDWIASTLVFIAIVGGSNYAKVGGGFYVPLVLFAEVVVFTVLIGGSFGQVALRMRVRRLDGTRLTPLAVVIRTFLILLVVPPLVYKPDGRGLHDMAVDSAVFVVA
ncbi:MAG: RDD family protein [Marmoricola sp.]